MKASRSIVAGLAGAGALMAATVTAEADAIADFYKGKSVNVYIGYAAGGGYDAYGRILARFMGGHIPGKPGMVPRNMPGAGSIALANALYNTLPKDGTAIGIIGRGVPMEPLFGRSGPKFDASKFNWIGSMNNEVSACVAFHTSKVKTIQDAMQREMILAGTAQGSDGVDFAIVLNNVLGTKFKLITGYPGGSTQQLAMERGEVEGRCGWSWSSIFATRGYWLKEGKLRILLQLALTGHPELDKMGVPKVMDLAKTDRDRQVLRLIFARQTMGRPFLAPPGIPADRVDALRKAFDTMVKDKTFLAAANKAKMEIEPVTGKEVADLIADVYKSPKDIVQAAADATARLERTKIDKKVFEDLKSKGKITKIENGGRKVTFDIGGGKAAAVGVSGSGTKLTIADKKANRKALKAGMNCAIVYPAPGSAAKSIACD
jgi:tripartite-type tricarboxylate transporter receptor subunit TctC